MVSNLRAYIILFTLMGVAILVFIIAVALAGRFVEATWVLVIAFIVLLLLDLYQRLTRP